MEKQGENTDFPRLDESGDTLPSLRKQITDQYIGVIVSSGDSLFRDGLVALINQWEEFCLIGAASTLDETKDLCVSAEFSVCIIDTAINDQALRTIRAIVDEAPLTKIIIISASGSDDDIVEALRGGIHGYCIRELIAADRVRGMIWGIISGAVMIYGLERSRLSKPSEVHAAMKNACDAVETLSKRETEVLGLLAQGLTNAEIGERLYLSEATVKKNISRIVNKLQVDNRIQAAVFASKYWG